MEDKKLEKGEKKLKSNPTPSKFENYSQKNKIKSFIGHKRQ